MNPCRDSENAQMCMSDPLPAIPLKDAIGYRLCIGESMSLAIKHEIRDEERKEAEERRLGFLFGKKRGISIAFDPCL